MDIGEEMNLKHNNSLGMDKFTSYGTIFLLFSTMIIGSIGYGQNEEKINNVIKKVDNYDKLMIPKSTVNQMFINRDIQIKAVADDVREVKDAMKIQSADSKEQLKLIQQILREMPKKIE